MNPEKIFSHANLNFDLLRDLQEKPAAFEPGEPLFWNDPHISAQMLATHLNPDIDAASRKPEIIAASVAWIAETLDLRQKEEVLDLGCGPGLYAHRLAQRGLAVTGVDYSESSIAYARQYAQDHDLDIDYRFQDYLTLADKSCYDAALLIYGDYCTFDCGQRSRLLENVHRALKQGGHFVLDVSTRQHRKKHGVQNGWYFSEGGFWRPGPHMVLEHGFDYPDAKIYLDQMIVVEENGKLTVYRNWFQDYDPEMITGELEEGGFEVVGLYSDLTGTPYNEESEWIGVVARRVD